MAALRTTGHNELRHVGGPQPAVRTRLLEDQPLLRGQGGAGGRASFSASGGQGGHAGGGAALTAAARPPPRKLKLLKPKEFESFVSTGCPKSQIVMVCVLQSWQPESRSILSMLQSTCAAHPAPPPTGPAPPLPAVCICCFSMRKMSAAELARSSVFGALQVG